MSSKNHDPTYDPYRWMPPPTNEEIALLEAALQRSGRPYTDDDLLMLMAWMTHTRLAGEWLARVLAGTGALVVEGEGIYFVPPGAEVPGDGQRPLRDGRDEG